MASKDEKKGIFRNLTADDTDPELSEVESLCLNCGENGSTRLFLTKIPNYNEIIVMSFSCPHCGYENNETQFGGKIQERGIRIKVLIRNENDLNRQVVKSDYADVQIPQVELEVPAQARKGEVTTVEGLIDSVIFGLNQDQTRRKEENPETAEKIEEFIGKLENLKSLSNPFHLILDDPSGNSFVENPFAPKTDNGMEITRYDRLLHQNEALGLANDEENNKELYIPEHEVAAFETNCHLCGYSCQTNMKPTKIPHFKEVIIMATTCDNCGHRTNEVKSGAGIEDKGLRIKVEVNEVRDLHRDVLKSDTCTVEIPQLELEVGPGAMGGRFTTIEGLLDTIKEQLATENPLIHGDSVQPHLKIKMADFLKRLEKVKSGAEKATIILDDPAGNSYVQNLNHPDPDANLEITSYERNYEQNEELGLNDMKTENYHEINETKT